MKKSLILLFFLCCFSACTAGRYAAELPPPVVTYIPWQDWSPGLKPSGEPYSNRFVLLADQLLESGKFVESIRQYYLALDSGLNAEEEESLRIRLATALLLNEQHQEALSQLSSFYKNRRLNVLGVSASGARMFGYIYGRMGNVNQALAWFSQALRVGGKAVSEQTYRATGTLLEKLSDAELMSAAGQWSKDRDLAPLLEEEMARRINSPRETPLADSQPFWGELQEHGLRTAEKTLPAGEYRIPVILPLSGRFAKFGLNLKNGLELALSQLQPGEAQYEFMDSEGNPARAESLCEQTAGAGRLIIGPLSAEETQQVADCTRDQEGFALVFTKKSDLQPGAGVYRLGMTVEAQTASLAETALKKLRLRRIALAYPAEAAYHSYAQSFREQLQNYGMQPVFEFPYYKDPLPDFLELDNELRSSKPEALLIIDELDMSERLLSALSENNRQNVKILATALWAEPERLRQASAIFDRSIFVAPFLADERELVSSFIGTYTAAYNQNPDWLAAQGFDAGTMVVASIRRAKSEGISFNSAFNSIKEYNGLTGEISVTAEGELNRRLKVAEYKEGGFIEVKPDSAPEYIYRGNEKIEAENVEKEKN